MKYFLHLKKLFCAFMDNFGRIFHLFDLNKLLGGMSEVVNSIFGDSNHVLNSASVLTKEINTGLDGYDLACAKLSAKTAGIKPWTLVDKQTDRMAERVTEGALVLRNCINNIYFYSSIDNTNFLCCFYSRFNFLCCNDMCLC